MHSFTNLFKQPIPRRFAKRSGLKIAAHRIRDFETFAVVELVVIVEIITMFPFD
jgi:hypothetical protein